MTTRYRIRLARPDDLPLLGAVDRAADTRYASTPFAEAIERFPSTSVEEFAALQDRWRLWVAADACDRPVGFAIVTVDDPETLHLNQVSVHPEHAGHRLAARIMDGISAFCEGRGLSTITITTFRDVPWNAPYYERLGFREVPDSEADTDPHLAPRLADQVARGLPRASRVAMIREL